MDLLQGRERGEKTTEEVPEIIILNGLAGRKSPLRADLIETHFKKLVSEPKKASNYSVMAFLSLQLTKYMHYLLFK